MGRLSGVARLMGGGCLRGVLRGGGRLAGGRAIAVPPGTCEHTRVGAAGEGSEEGRSQIKTTRGAAGALCIAFRSERYDMYESACIHTSSVILALSFCPAYSITMSL